MLVRIPTIPNIASNIKDYRIKHNKTQAEMADMLEIHRQTYSQLERGKYTPSLEKLIEFCDILDITPNELLLDGQDFDDYKKNVFEKLDASVLDMLNVMKIVEAKRVEAALAKEAHKFEEEEAILNEIIFFFAKGVKGRRKIADMLYYDYINEHIKTYSNTALSKLLIK